MLQIVGLTFLFSSGLAILYPIALAYFVFCYIRDKTLLVHFDRKPKNFDGELAEQSVWWFKWILVGHFVLGIFMYANPNLVITGKLSDNVFERVQKAFGGRSGNDFLQAHVLVFFWFAIALAAAYLLWMNAGFIIDFFKTVCKINQTKKFYQGNKNQYFVYDFYSVWSQNNLKRELNAVEKQLKECTSDAIRKRLNSKQEAIENALKNKHSLEILDTVQTYDMFENETYDGLRSLFRLRKK